jgi:hypothetical protein
MAGERYTVSVRGQELITDTLLLDDVQWLISLPE